MKIQILIGILFLNIYACLPPPDINKCCPCMVNQTSTLMTFYSSTYIPTVTTAQLPVSFAVSCTFNQTYVADYKDLNSNASQAFISKYIAFVRLLNFLN